MVCSLFIHGEIHLPRALLHKHFRLSLQSTSPYPCCVLIWYWQAMSNTEFPGFPLNLNTFFLTTSFPCSWLSALSATASKSAKPQKWKDGAIIAWGGKVTDSWEWEERLGLVMDVQRCSLHSTAEESPMQACSIHVFLAQGSAKISVSLKGNMQPLKIQSQIFCKHWLYALRTND